MAILSEKRQKCFGLRRKDVRMRAIICDDDGRFAKKLEQLIMQYYRNMGMTIDTTVVTNPQNLLKRNDLANFDIAFLDADMKPIDGIEVGRALRKRKPKIIIVFVYTFSSITLRQPPWSSIRKLSSAKKQAYVHDNGI